MAKEADEKLKKKVNLLATALDYPPPSMGNRGEKKGVKEQRRKTPLGRVQSAYCKESGHWKMSAPIAREESRGLPACLTVTSPSHTKEI